MGISLNIVVPKEKKKSLYNFLKKNVKPWHKVWTGTKAYPKVKESYSQVFEETSYGAGVGFDQNSAAHPLESAYIRSIVKAVATLVNPKNPKYNYDGDKALKVTSQEVNVYLFGNEDKVFGKETMELGKELITKEIEKIQEAWNALPKSSALKKTIKKK